MRSSAATGNSDPRVQAIRCCSCRRLRPHPIPDVPDSMWCWCGGREFVESGVFPDEEEWAVTIYEKEIKDAELWKYT